MTLETSLSLNADDNFSILKLKSLKQSTFIKGQTVTSTVNNVTLLHVTPNLRISDRDEVADDANLAAFPDAGLDEKAIHQLVQQLYV